MSEAQDKKRGLPDRVKMRHDSHFVEDLTAREMEPIGRMAPLTSIVPHPEKPPTELGDLPYFASSIAENGHEQFLQREIQTVNGHGLKICSGGS